MPCNQAGNMSSERGREPAVCCLWLPVSAAWMAALHDKPHTQGANRHNPQCLACQNYRASSIKSRTSSRCIVILQQSVKCRCRKFTFSHTKKLSRSRSKYITNMPSYLLLHTLQTPVCGIVKQVWGIFESQKLQMWLACFRYL